MVYNIPYDKFVWGAIINDINTELLPGGQISKVYRLEEYSNFLLKNKQYLELEVLEGLGQNDSINNYLELYNDQQINEQIKQENIDKIMPNKSNCIVNTYTTSPADYHQDMYIKMSKEEEQEQCFNDSPPEMYKEKSQYWAKSWTKQPEILYSTSHPSQEAEIPPPVIMKKQNNKNKYNNTKFKVNDIIKLNKIGKSVFYGSCNVNGKFKVVNKDYGIYCLEEVNPGKHDFYKTLSIIWEHGVNFELAGEIKKGHALTNAFKRD